MIETTVQNFRILEHLGGGAMGLVYKAEDTRDGRIVALKFLPFELKDDPEARKRFLREAQAASNLRHENICPIVEIDEAVDGRLFVALEYFEGRTLKKHLEKGALPIEEALDIARQVAAGLGEAHSHGLVHRDLVPANVLVTEDGTVKILDFGLAKRVSQGGLTQIGWSLGTPEYMSPEQIRGDDTDRTTDLWSLGVMLYEMLVGRNPFVGGNLAAVLTAIQNRTPQPIRESRPDAPEALDGIVALLLAKDPAERYASCEALLGDLGGEGETPRIPDETPTSSAHIGTEEIARPTPEQIAAVSADDDSASPSPGGIPAWMLVLLAVIVLVLIVVLL